MNERLDYLYRQYISNDYSDDELQEFTEMLNNPAEQQHLATLMDGTWDELKANGLRDITADKANDIYFSVTANRQIKPKNNYYWIGIAATLFLAALFGIYFYLPGRHSAKPTSFITQKTKPVTEVLPGADRAVLTLGNGKQVILNDTKTNAITIQPDVVVHQNKTGLVYAVNKTSLQQPAALSYNTITVPKGGQYQLSLTDGTQVFLNAGSALTYPAKFSGNTREVTLKGEAYFEVAKNPAMPFKVNVVEKQQIEVLGTHFNVKAYADEAAVNTTLLEGSVKILSAQNQVVLKPGQMAVNHPAKNITVKTADLDEVMAWKNGVFIFNNENIVGIMQKVARWYNVDVVFKGDMANVNFTGNYSRQKSLNNLLKSIALINKIHFVMEGRSVTVIAK
ncbi:MAG: FecR family protein [Sphingobacteriaceae bacterium]|nr:MAG: FecR family protein [Sphingobacteriaceae bacterium]